MAQLRRSPPGPGSPPADRGLGGGHGRAGGQGVRGQRAGGLAAPWSVSRNSVPSTVQVSAGAVRRDRDRVRQPVDECADEQCQIDVLRQRWRNWVHGRDRPPQRRYDGAAVHHGIRLGQAGQGPSTSTAPRGTARRRTGIVRVLGGQIVGHGRRTTARRNRRRARTPPYGAPDQIARQHHGFQRGGGPRAAVRTSPGDGVAFRKRQHPVGDGRGGRMRAVRRVVGGSSASCDRRRCMCR